MTDCEFLLDPYVTEAHELVALIQSLGIPAFYPRPAMATGPEYEEFLRRRIAGRVIVDANGCWIWQGSIGRTGYGRMGAFGSLKAVAAHRVSYMVFIGEIPIGLELDHLCGKPPCVRPDHLEPVTHAENVRRAHAARPPRSHCANGHEFTRENTGQRSDGGGRVCRQCRRERNARRRVSLREPGKPNDWGRTGPGSRSEGDGAKAPAEHLQSTSSLDSEQLSFEVAA